jgi:hypothetical protein
MDTSNVDLVSRTVSRRTIKYNGLALMRANPLILLARLAGIEPTTPWFVAKYSIQLSYSREA